MLIEVKHELKKMKRDRSGERFKNEHNRVRKHGVNDGWVRVICFVLAFISAAVGIVLVFIPGPAFVFFILSGTLLASQSWKVACLLDRAELALKNAWTRSKQRYQAHRKAGRKSTVKKDTRAH